MGNKYKVYYDTYHRDIDKDFIYEANHNLWPHITMLDIDNIEDSVQFSKYEDNEYTFMIMNENTEYIAKKISLYDILVISSTEPMPGSLINERRNIFEIRKNISDILVTDIVIGICVIPSNVIDEYARFITMFDIDDKNYGGYSGRELDLQTGISSFFTQHSQEYGIDKINRGLNYHNSLYFNVNSPSKFNFFISLDSHIIM